uniref:Uncharacterized protein n=1 Tax=Xiphophorus couchianus TaxID=32473 RepID=A0A3B5MG79_9TELE
MASASSSAQAAFGLGRRKKNPGLLDQIGKFFGGDKKRKGKVRKGGRGPNLSGLGGLLLCMLVIFADFTPRTTRAKDSGIRFPPKRRRPEIKFIQSSNQRSVSF